MQLPELLQSKIEEIFENTSLKGLRDARESLSLEYRKGATSPFDNEAKRLAYLGARMPATFAACTKVLSQVNLSGHLLDLGAGPGTASWAALELFPNIEKVTLIEKNRHAIELGKILGEVHPKLKDANWVEQTLDQDLPKGDAAILSYVLTEIKDPKRVLSNCFDAAPMLLIIEPGTPRGFEAILTYRKYLLELGANILAPCPHAHQCPIMKSDWCHFSARVERNRIHRELKTGTLGYEDEKFCYLIASKVSKPQFSKRIIRRPIRKSGHILMTLCSESGKIEESCFSKKDKDLYRKVKKSEWGDSLKNP